jgi:hypothetical protein
MLIIREYESRCISYHNSRQRCYDCWIFQLPCDTKLHHTALSKAWVFLHRDFELVKSNPRQSLTWLAILLRFFSRSPQCILRVQRPTWLLCLSICEQVTQWLIGDDPYPVTLEVMSQLPRSHDDCVCNLLQLRIEDFWARQGFWSEIYWSLFEFSFFFLFLH